MNTEHQLKSKLTRLTFLFSGGELTFGGGWVGGGVYWGGIFLGRGGMSKYLAGGGDSPHPIPSVGKTLIV